MTLRTGKEGNMKFELGDKVKINEKGSSYHNETGIIFTGTLPPYAWRVKFDFKHPDKVYDWEAFDESSLIKQGETMPEQRDMKADIQKFGDDMKEIGEAKVKAEILYIINSEKEDKAIEKVKEFLEGV